MDANACHRRGIRPASNANRPASTAWRIADAIRTGSFALVIALASSTPSQPSSIANAASEAVPIPASRMIGTPACSTIRAMLCGLRIPSPLPIGEPSGITAEQPVCSSRLATTGSSFVYANTTNPSFTSRSAASNNSTTSGSNVMSSPMTSSFTQSVSNASRPSFAVRTASRAVKHPAVFGNTRRPSPRSTSSNEPDIEGSTRRMATVVISVPDASNAAASTSRLGAPPVPVINRDPNDTPAITNASTPPASSTIFGAVLTVTPRSPSLNDRSSTRGSSTGVVIRPAPPSTHRSGRRRRSRCCPTRYAARPRR